MSCKKVSLKKVGVFLMVVAAVVAVVWFFFLRETPSGKAYAVVDAMKEAKLQYDNNKNTPAAYDAANACATAALEAKQYRDGLTDPSDIEDFNKVYLPVAKQLRTIVVKEEIFDDAEEVDALFGE